MSRVKMTAVKVAPDRKIDWTLYRYHQGYHAREIKQEEQVPEILDGLPSGPEEDSFLVVPQWKVNVGWVIPAKDFMRKFVPRLSGVAFDDWIPSDEWWDQSY